MVTFVERQGPVRARCAGRPQARPLAHGAASTCMRRGAEIIHLRGVRTYLLVAGAGAQTRWDAIREHPRRGLRVAAERRKGPAKAGALDGAPYRLRAHHVDERNEEAIIARQPRIAAPIRTAYVSTGYTALTLPEPIKVWRAGPRPLLSGFQPEQKFCFALFGEKSSLSPVLRPFGERHGADLYIAVGELSEARAYEMARPTRCRRWPQARLLLRPIRTSKPIGHVQMPVSIARKLPKRKGLQFPPLRLHRAAGRAHPR